MNYKYPSFWYKTVDYSTLTQATLDEWAKECEECNKENKKIRDGLNALHQQALDLCRKIWGDKNKVTSYLKKQSVPSMPWLTVDHYQKEFNKRNDEAAKKQQEAAHRAYMDDYLIKCYNYCVKHNLSCESLGLQDRAESHAYEARCNQLIKNEEYIDFGGQNCDGPCEGWMPGEHRCSCGNRRVDFVCGDSHIETGYVYAEAY